MDIVDWTVGEKCSAFVAKRVRMLKFIINVTRLTYIHKLTVINHFVSDGRSKRQYYQIQINCALTLTIQWQIAQSNENLIQIQLIRFIPISSINQSVIKTNRSPVNICHISSKLSWLIRNKIRHGRKQKLVSFMDSFSRSNTLNSSGLSFNKWWFKLDSIICFFEHQDYSIQTQYVSDKWAVELNCF